MQTNFVFKPTDEKRFRAPKLTRSQLAGLLVYLVTRHKTQALKQAIKSRNEAWRAHAERLQAELDAERYH